MVRVLYGICYKMLHLKKQLFLSGHSRLNMAVLKMMFVVDAQKCDNSKCGTQLEKFFHTNFLN